MSVTGFLKHAWNAFVNMDTDRLQTSQYGPSYGTRPDLRYLGVTNERTIISSIYTRIAIDVAAIPIRHVQLDEAGRYLQDRSSGLNDCLTVEPNLDQGPRALRQDIVTTLFDEGTTAIVPIDTTVRPDNPGSYDIQSMRVGSIIQWFPSHVRVSLYNEKTGRREELNLDKRHVAVIDNPLYRVMNQPNSTLQRLRRKLSLLDAVDEASSSGKLDVIIQLPYVVKSDAMRDRAERRRKDLEEQLAGSKYGIGYADGTEKITQLNRPVENNLLGQIQYLTEMLYSELGLTPEVMNGTADEKTMINYYNRTIEPILTSIVEGMRRTFLTKTARTQGQSIDFFRDPFKLVPVAQIADIADKFTRNEILSSNEFRQVIGFRPSKDPKADELRNSNMPQSELGQEPLKVPSTRATPAAIE